MYRYDPSGQAVVTEEMVNDHIRDGVLHLKLAKQYNMSTQHLGDSLGWYAIFAHYKNIVMYINESDINPDCAFMRLMPLFSHLCNVEIRFNNTDHSSQPASAHRWMWQLDIPFAEPKLTETYIHDKPFVTKQFKAKTSSRSIKLEDQKILLDEIPEDYDIIDLSDNDYTLDGLFSVVKAAEYHIGCNSGITWIASSVNTESRILMTKTNFPNELCEFAVLMDRTPNINIIRDDLIGGY